MKIERTKNATRNIKFGFFLRIYQIIVPFLMRTAMIHFMGVEYLGLNSLFTSVIHVLNMAELGVGVAMVFSMYKPIAEDDEEKICALMALYRTYYRVIGLFIAVVGVLLTPVIPKLITGHIPAELNVYVLYLLNLGLSVLTYWLFAYKNCLFQAHQRTSVVSIITCVTNTVQYAVQLGALIFFRSYYFYVIASLFSQVLNNVVTAIAADRIYPRYRARGALDKGEVKVINRKIKDLFTAKFGGVILNSSDTIVISSFLGLTILAIYQNYYFIMKSVISIVEIIFGSIMAGLGNSFLTETREKNYKDLQKFTFLFVVLISVCTCCFLGLYQPFMEIWVGKDLMLEFGAVISFAIYFYVFTINRLLNVYKDAAGLWHQDRFRPLVGALVNLALNLLWVRRWGIYGVLFSTVVSMVFVGMPWVLHNLFSLFFARKMLKGYVGQMASYALVAAASGCLVCLICNCLVFSTPWITLFVRLLICLVLPCLLFYLFFHKTIQFRESIALVNKIVKRTRKG